MERRVIFGKTYIEPDTLYLDESLVRENKRLIAEYKYLIEKLKSRDSLFEYMEKNFVSNLYHSFLTYRSTEGTQEVEGVSFGWDELIKGLHDRKSVKDFEEVVTSLNISKLYSEYELPKVIEINTIKEIHKKMFKSQPKYRPGHIRKKGDSDVMISSSNKLFVASKDVEEYLIYFTNYINSTGDMDPVVRIAMIHAILLGIHPFADGNGRVVRLITDKLLSDLLGVPLYLSEMINKTIDSGEYKLALDSFHLNMQSSNIIHYFYDTVNKQLSLNIDNIKTMTDVFNRWLMALLKEGVINKKYIDALAMILTFEPGFNITYIEKNLGVSRVTATKIINLLFKYKYIEESMVLSKTIIYKASDKKIRI